MTIGIGHCATITTSKATQAVTFRFVSSRGNLMDQGQMLNVKAGCSDAHHDNVFFQPGEHTDDDHKVNLLDHGNGKRAQVRNRDRLSKRRNKHKSIGKFELCQAYVRWNAPFFFE